MTLSDIAAGIEVTTEQRERGVPTVDDTDVDLVDRLGAHADALPCTPAACATILDAYAAGTSVGDAAREAAVAPMTASKALHRCGLTGLSPLSPMARDVLCDWLDGELSRADALDLTGASEVEFALATYIETHDPVAELADAVEGSFAPAGNATVEKRDALGETMTSPMDLQ